MNSRPDKPVFAEERKIAIVELVGRGGAVTVGELCARFDVSPATIRNDLRDLERTGALTRTHGGAMPKQRTGSETTLDDRSGGNVEARQSIAALALDCIEDGDTLILDVGTTTHELALLLGGRRNVRVVTNDLRIGCLADQYPSLDIYVLSGRVRSGYHCTLGASAVRSLSDFAVDKVFLGTNGFDPEHGASTPDAEQAEIKRAMIQAAQKRYLLCDSGKFGKLSFVRFAEIDQIDVLITDRIARADMERLERIDVEVRTGRIDD